jgi:hypothetical protein
MGQHPLSNTAVVVQTCLPVDRCQQLVLEAAHSTVGKPHLDIGGTATLTTRVHVFHPYLPRIAMSVVNARARRAPDPSQTWFDFSACIDPTEYGSMVRTQIDNYRTSRMTYGVMGVLPIPIGPRAIPFHNSYELYMYNMAALIASADRTAQVTIYRKGKMETVADPVRDAELVRGRLGAKGNQPDARTPPADWYPDPQGGNRLRYWDGSQWTDHTSA